ncbi:MAG: hypothetical protein ACOZNI_23745 [Myxococcota bacterium]
MWGTARSAIELTDSGAVVGSVSTTSTTTLNVHDGSGNRVLRTFDIGSATLSGAFGDLGYTFSGSNAPAATPLTTPTDQIWDLSRICYLDSDTSFAFSVDSGDLTPTTQTAIPTQKYAADWAYEKITAFTEVDVYSWGRTVFETSGAMAAFYKDPHVLEVPAKFGGGYLMILVRGRVLASQVAFDYDVDASDADAVMGELNQYQSPGQCIADLVCYYSTSATFEGATTKGPFLLAHSLTALVDPYLRDHGYADTTAAFRTWLGVPGAVFVGDDLYLYYVANATRQLTYATWLDADDRWEECVAAFEGGGGFEQNIVFRRISGTDLAASVVFATPSDELTWTTADEITGSDSLPIRVFMAVQGSTTYEVTWLKDACLRTAELVAGREGATRQETAH